MLKFVIDIKIHKYASHLFDLQRRHQTIHKIELRYRMNDEMVKESI